MRTLRPYQRDSLRYAQRTQHPALFLDMRLGKTIIAIRRCQDVPARRPEVGPRFLVVAPNSALGSWAEELELEQEHHVVHLQGTRKQRLAKLFSDQPRERVWYLLNKEGHLALEEIARVPWDGVIWDETFWLGNPKAKVTRFFHKHFRSVPHRWALTGTPNPESQLQLVSQILWLRGECLGYKNFWKFRSACAEPDRFGWNWRLLPGPADELRDWVDKEAYRLTWEDAGLEVRKVRERRYLDMPDKLRKAYRKAERDFVLEFGDHPLRSTIWSLTKWMWLRRMAGGFLADDGTPVWRGKLAELTSLLTGELSGEQVVVWFTFNSELHAAAEALTKAGVRGHRRLYGDVPVAGREHHRRAFQNGSVRVLLVQQAVAQTGMNLSAAGASVYYSEPAGLMARRQTEDRIISVGDRKGVLYVHLLTRDTVDEDVHEANRAKGYRSELGLGNRLRKLLLERSSE